MYSERYRGILVTSTYKNKDSMEMNLTMKVKW